MLAGFVIPWGLGAAAVHLVSCRRILGHACLISPGVWIAFSFLARICVISPGVAFLVFPSSASLGGGYVPDACPRSHHLIVSCGCDCFVLIVLVCCAVSSHHVISSHRGRLSCGGQRASSSRLVLIELGKTAQNGISHSSHRMSSGFSFLVSSCRLVLPSRVASRALSVIMLVACGEGRVLRSCSFLSRRGEAECPSLVLCRGGVLALILRLSSRSSSRQPSRSPMSVSRMPWRLVVLALLT